MCKFKSYLFLSIGKHLHTNITSHSVVMAAQISRFIEDSFNLTPQMFHLMSPASKIFQNPRVAKLKELSEMCASPQGISKVLSPLTEAFLDTSVLKQKRFLAQPTKEDDSVSCTLNFDDDPQDLKEAITYAVHEIFPLSYPEIRPDVYGSSILEESPCPSTPLGPRPACIGQELAPLHTEAASRNSPEQQNFTRFTSGKQKSRCSFKSLARKFQSLHKHIKSKTSTKTVAAS